VYNRHHTDDQIATAHSSLDKEFPSLLAVLKNTSKTQIIKPNKSKRNLVQRQKTKLKCYQINLQHSRATTDNLMQIMNTENIDITFTQEPYVYQNRIK